MDDMEKDRVALKIMEAILADVTDRHGWSQEWDGFADDTKQEIKNEWVSLIKDQLPVQTRAYY